MYEHSIGSWHSSWPIIVGCTVLSAAGNTASLPLCRRLPKHACTSEEQSSPKRRKVEHHAQSFGANTAPAADPLQQLQQLACTGHATEVGQIYSLLGISSSTVLNNALLTSVLQCC